MIKNLLTTVIWFFGCVIYIVEITFVVDLIAKYFK